MSGDYGFVHLIPAQPGWRVVEIWSDDPEAPDLHFVPIVGWAELEDSRGELLPICDDGMGFTPIVIEEGSIYFAVLAPGEEIDFEDPDRAWRQRIANWRTARLADESDRGQP